MLHCLNVIPTKWSTTKPQITRQIKQLTCRKQRDFSHACLTNNPRDWSTYQDFLNDSVMLLLTDMNLILLMGITMLQKKLWCFIKNRKKLVLMHLPIVEQPMLILCLKVTFWLNTYHQFSLRKMLALW